MKQNKPLLHAFLLILLSISTTTVSALPEDENQPIRIQSDRAERDDNRGVTIYVGDVEIDQGTLHIEADKVVIESKDNDVSRIIATGSPAKMRQRPTADKEIVRAHGNTIKYDIDKELMILLDNASIEQQGSVVSSERIDYYMADGVVKAQGNAYSSTKKRRVEMVIPPKNTENNKP
jgi:lipopolysaccharide export system protein LptA